jgi:hypothetical protein
MVCHKSLLLQKQHVVSFFVTLLNTVTISTEEYYLAQQYIYSGASVYEHPCLRTIRFTNKFSEQKTPRVTNGVSDDEHNLATASN